MIAPHCGNCRYRLDVTLWGLWMFTGCTRGLVLCARCAKWQGTHQLFEHGGTQ